MKSTGRFHKFLSRLPVPPPGPRPEENMEKSAGAVHLGLCIWLSLVVAGTAVPFEPTASLPDVLTTRDGAAVTTAAQWGTRRAELKALLDQTILGSKPKTRPALASHTVIAKRAPPGGVAIERVGLKFAGVAGTVEIELLYRTGRAAAPAAAVLTQFDHRDWALRGLSRGFVGVVMPTGDTVDGTWWVGPRDWVTFRNLSIAILLLPGHPHHPAHWLRPPTDVDVSPWRSSR